jgi:Nuclease-related domain
MPDTQRRAGQFVQARADRLNTSLSAICGASIAVLAIAFAVGVRGVAILTLAVVTFAVMLIADQLLEPEIGRWTRGAQGERKVGAILEGLGPEWHVLHDVALGRGNIDHVLVGPGGAFTIETKSHRGHISIDRLDPQMTSQAYAEKKLLETVSGLRVEPLLVFSEAYLVGSVPAHRRGVTVLPARMLAGYLGRRRPVFTASDAAEIGETLRLALEVDAA